MNEEKSKQSLKLQIGRMSREELVEVMGVIHFLSGLGLKALEELDWEEVKKVAPVLEKMSPDLNTHLAMGDICHTAFSKWFKDILADTPPDLNAQINLQEFEKSARDLD